MTNIALVVLDTLRKDRFDEYFDWIPGTRFERAYSTANWTVPVHASIFTGLYPSEVGVHSKHTVFDFPQPVLAEILSENGYTTRAFSANTNVSAHFNFHRGFDEFKSPEQMRHLNDSSIVDWREFNVKTEYSGIRKYLSAIKTAIVDDVNTIESLLAAIQLQLSDDGTKAGVQYGGTLEAIEEYEKMDIGENEFVFFNLMEAHEPYQAPKEYQSISDPGLTESVGDISYGSTNDKSLIQSYDDCARYLSDAYRDLFNRLKDDFDYVITVSDHGELLGEFDSWGHEYGVYPELIHVPLVVTGPGRSDTLTHDPVSILEIYETILDIAGLDRHSRRGQSFLNQRDELKSFLSEYHGLTSWSEKNLREHGYNEQIELYDSTLRGITTTGGYYYQTKDGLASDNESVDDSIEKQLKHLVDELDERSVEVENDIPDEIRNQLEDLGYA